MPSKLPVINVRITQHQRDLLTELGELQGRSAASFLREMLDTATPMLLAVLPLHRAAQKQAQMQPQVFQEAVRGALAGVDAQRDQLDFLKLISEASPNTANDIEGSERTERSEGEPKPSMRRRKC